MLLIAKIIGGLCTVAIPTGICSVQVLLTKTQQENQKKAIDTEVKKTKEALTTAYQNYQVQIARINQEKNNLATTKQALTYIPVEITAKINELIVAKSTYETKHNAVQEEIKASITKHNTAVGEAKEAVEKLWSNEKTRVEGIQQELEKQITQAKGANKTLQDKIDVLKTEIDTTINKVFNPPTGP